MAKIGIIVGRFQTASLHAGHKSLIDFVIKENDQVVIFIGTNEARLTTNNPLSFHIRHDMIQREYLKSNMIIYPLFDHKSDEVWIKQLDEKIDKIKDNEHQITLYGSRDSFLSKYSGKHKTKEFKSPLPTINSTELRSFDRVHAHNSYEWRKGIIYSSAHKYPTSYQTTDTAIVDFDHHRLLLGRKKGCEKFQFIGGFVDVSDESFELSAKREVMEETGKIETDNYRYIGSYRIDDWRYRNEQDKIMTAFFCCHYIFGHPQASDDMDELKWHDIAVLSENDFEPEHHILYHAFKKYIATHGK